jgi:hypothetical protein
MLTGLAELARGKRNALGGDVLQAGTIGDARRAIFPPAGHWRSPGSTLGGRHRRDLTPS